jgi:hypothetical protein
VLLTDAVAVLLLLQVPPATVSVRVMLAVAHTVDGPEIVPEFGRLFTNMLWVALAIPQALVTVYDMLAVPAVSPYTSPVVLIVAMEGALLDHTPPEAVSVSETVVARHTPKGPSTVPASGVPSIII